MSAPARSSGAGELMVELIDSFDELLRLEPEWQRLFAASRTRNPFAGPTCVTAWAQEFVPERDIFVLTVRAERLIGVVPLYRHRLIGGVVTGLRPIGSGHHVELFELPQPLTEAGQARRVLRAALAFAFEHGERIDMLELCLAPTQGWFEPQWIPDSSRSMATGAFVMHKSARACVVLDLESSVERAAPRLKRNVRESVRRSRNRLSRAGNWAVREEKPGQMVDLLAHRLVTLHEARGALRGKVRHGSYFADRSNIKFLKRILSFDSADCVAEPLVLELNGEAIAGLLTLRSLECLYLSFSGFLPQSWDLGPVTALIAHAVERGAAAGCRHFNFSPGPDVAKLRWGETLEIYNEFLMAFPGPRAHLAVGSMWTLRAAAQIRRESRRHQRT